MAVTSSLFSAWDVMRHMIAGKNLGFITTRQTSDPWGVLVTEDICGHKSCAAYDINTLFPLYHYPYPNEPGLFDMGTTTPGGRRPNLKPEFVAALEQHLGLHFIPDGRGNLQETIGPEDLFHYAYSALHSPTYRSLYEEFLAIAFARLPLTSDVSLFATLAEKGAELVDIHLLRLPGDDGVGGNGGATILVSPGKQGVTFPKPGSGTVEKVDYVAPQGSHPGRVGINNEQYFEGIEPETWEMHIGGYQPLDKWLKDRKGRALSFEDIQHYLRIVIALRETRRIMAEIDELIPGWPLV